MTSIRDRVIARRENMRGFTGVYDAEGHIEMARRLRYIPRPPASPRHPPLIQKLSYRQVMDIRDRYERGAGQPQQLAEEYQVSQTTISNIIQGRIYLDVEAS